MKIEDGQGHHGDAGVSENQRLEVSARSNKRIYYVSRDDGRAFVWTSTYNTGGANEEILYIKNTSTTRHLFIDSAHYSAAAACLFTMSKHTGTPTGTVNTGESLNYDGKSPEATSFGNAAVTASAIGNALAFLEVVANAEGDRNWNGEIVLGEGDALIVTASVDDVVHFALTGFFEAID